MKSLCVGVPDMHRQKNYHWNTRLHTTDSQTLLSLASPLKKEAQYCTIITHIVQPSFSRSMDIKKAKQVESIYCSYKQHDRSKKDTDIQK